MSCKPSFGAILLARIAYLFLNLTVLPVGNALNMGLWKVLNIYHRRTPAIWLGAILAYLPFIFLV
jgi:hypothetical protein